MESFTRIARKAGEEIWHGRIWSATNYRTSIFDPASGWQAARWYDTH